MATASQSLVLLIRGPRGGSSETYSAIPLFRAAGYCRTSNPLQLAGFRPAEGPCEPLSPATISPASSGGGAKHRCVGDREEGENQRSRQAYSGRPARMEFGLAPVASNGPVSPQLGDAGSRRSNQSSACQSREQRDTGPRTPLHVNEGRPRARYDTKESNRCNQVEYDSC